MHSLGASYCIAGHQRAQLGLVLPRIMPVRRDGPLPMSFAQQRLWLLDQLQPGNTAYNMVYSLRIEGELNVTALRMALMS